MEITCLSVPNPKSYLICTGIADVENRGFAPDYRGPLYIHSTGRHAFRGMPDMSRYPVPLIHEFNDLLAQIHEMDRTGRYISIPDHGVRVSLKNEDAQSERAIAEYELLTDVYRSYKKDPTATFFRVKAIIGRVDLVDVVERASSPWAEDGYKHWILENPVLFDSPITGIATSRTGLWTHEIRD